MLYRKRKEYHTYLYNIYIMNYLIIYNVTQNLCFTLNAFVENVKRAYHQASIWRFAKAEDPPELDVEKYEWKGHDVIR